jgi:ribosome-binding factor A
MKPKRPLQRELPPLCSQLNADDGIDPREFFRSGGSRKKSGRKTLQLCSQVRDALSYLLAGDGNDDLLALFDVADVRPAPDESQLLVIVRPAVQPDRMIDPSEVGDRLRAASVRLRAGVAQAITRKRVPKLLFQVDVGPATEGTA